MRSIKVQCNSSIICASRSARGFDNKIKKKMNEYYSGSAAVVGTYSKVVRYGECDGQRDTHISVNSP